MTASNLSDRQRKCHATSNCDQIVYYLCVFIIFVETHKIICHFSEILYKPYELIKMIDTRWLSE